MRHIAIIKIMPERASYVKIEQERGRIALQRDLPRLPQFAIGNEYAESIAKIKTKYLALSLRFG